MTQTPIACLIYDFDKTLSPRDMQEYGFLPGLGIPPEQFWADCRQAALMHEMDGVLAYMYMMCERARGVMPITRALLEMDMGVTLLSGTGAYKNLPTQVVMCAFSRGYIIPVKKLVQRIDPDAFVIVCDTHEILGEGFGTYDPTGL